MAKAAASLRTSPGESLPGQGEDTSPTGPTPGVLGQSPCPVCASACSPVEQKARFLRPSPREAGAAWRVDEGGPSQRGWD